MSHTKSESLLFSERRWIFRSICLVLNCHIARRYRLISGSVSIHIRLSAGRDFNKTNERSFSSRFMTYLFISHNGMHAGALAFCAARAAREIAMPLCVSPRRKSIILICAHCAHKRQQIDIERPHLQRGISVFSMCIYLTQNLRDQSDENINCSCAKNLFGENNIYRYRIEHKMYKKQE